MIWRIVRRVFRLAGWLMTPMVIFAAGGAGAFLLALLAPKFSITAGLVLVGGAAILGAIAGLLLWMKLLRQNPELRHVLAVTSEGVPEGKAVEEMFELDRPAPGGGSP
jgi:uncharacterized membrane protein YebE (DUF533 family)